MILSKTIDDDAVCARGARGLGITRFARHDVEISCIGKVDQIVNSDSWKKYGVEIRCTMEQSGWVAVRRNRIVVEILTEATFEVLVENMVEPKHVYSKIVNPKRKITENCNILTQNYK